MEFGAGLFRLHRAVIDPQQRSVGLTVLRGTLTAAEWAYAAAVSVRNCLYHTGARKQIKADVPVISVGNITAGGTGKTPFVAWLARLLAIHKLNAAILSRGYGRHERLGVDDENELLARQVADTPIVVDPKRVRGAREAVSRHGAELVILDDGFQHRRLARDLDIVLVDAVWPFGGGHLLPRGLLREPLRELARADVLVITRAGLVSSERLRTVKKRLGRYAPKAPMAVCDSNPTGLRRLLSNEKPATDLSRIRTGCWAAFCGIGNPESFRLMLTNAGCDLVLHSVFSDHEKYTRSQIERVLRQADGQDCIGVLTTEKDAAKVERLLDAPTPLPIYAVQADLEFLEGSEALVSAILDAAGKTS